MHRNFLDVSNARYKQDNYLNRNDCDSFARNKNARDKARKTTLKIDDI